MTLVLSMNPFLDPEGDPPLSTYQTIWESERCTKTCLTNSALPCSSEEHFTPDAPCRRVPDHVSVSRIAYFKRKFVDDDDEAPFSFRTYCQTVAPVLEERAHVLRLSLEKMRFIDDPEAFLRRSVLVNNLLRRLRAEILLQSTDWCFPTGPAFTSGPCVPPPNTNPAHLPVHGALPARICVAPQAGPPLRKRLRMLRGGQADLRPDCAQTCCCIYAAAAAAAAAGHYLHLPFSVYDAALSACPSTPHSSFFQLASPSKLGTMTIHEHDDEEEDCEEEEDEDEEEEEEEEEENEEEEAEREGDAEQKQAGPSLSSAKDKQIQKARTRTLLARANARTAEGVTEPMEDDEDEEEQGGEEYEEEEDEEVVRPFHWVRERELQGAGFWHRRAHRQ